MKFLLTLWVILSLSCLSAQAAFTWGKGSQKIIERSEFAFVDTYTGTSWGGCNTKAGDLNPDISKIDFEVNSGLFKKDLTLRFYLHSNSSLAGRDLIILFTGVFSGVADRGAKDMAYRVANAGKNVLVLPNPLSRDFIRAKAEGIEPGNVMQEGRFYYKLIKGVLQKEVKDRGILIKNIDFLGISYGGFLAAVVNALDSKNKKDRFANSVTLFSPPIDISVALANIDRDLDEIDSIYSHSPLTAYAKSIYKVCDSESDRDFSEDLMNVSKVMTLHIAFHSEFVKSVKQYNKNHDGKLIPEAAGNIFSRKYRRWKRGVRFRDLINNHLHSSRQFMSSNESKIDHHLNLSFQNRGFSNVKIFSAENDFLNDGLIWLADMHADVKTTPYGGHLGYTATKWFRKLIKTSYFTPMSEFADSNNGEL